MKTEREEMNMSLNYYIHTKDTNMAFDLMPRVKMDKENREFVIHLCQTQVPAWNLKPTFECHSYSSFKELKEILLNKEYDFVIRKEYGVEVSPEEFIKEMEEINAESKSRMEKNDKYIFADEDGFEFMNCEFF
jgi:hypothetical protein